MSTIKALVPYQNDTNARFSGQSPYQHGHHRTASAEAAAQPAAQPSGPTPRPAMTGAPQRQPDFLTQLLVANDSDLRRALGRRDLADQRQAAYGEALASRPSARPLSFLRVIGSA